MPAADVERKDAGPSTDRAPAPARAAPDPATPDPATSGPSGGDVALPSGIQADPPRRAGLGTRLLLLASVVIWGSTFVAMKILVAYVTPLELVGLRFSLGLPVLFLLLRAKRIPIRFGREDLGPLAIGSMILLVHFTAQPFALSLSGTTATNTGWIIGFSPLCIALLSRVLLGERLARGQLAGIALATFGVVLLVSRGDAGRLGSLTSLGDWIILGTAFTWALYTITTRDLARRRSPLTVTLIMFLPVCALGLATVVARASALHFSAWPASAVIALLFLGILGTLAQWFWQLGVARLGASRAGIYLYLEPLATTALAVPLLGEPFGLAAAIGGALLLLGVWLGQRAPARG